MKLFKRAFITISVVLIFHGVILINGAYNYVHTDTVMHVLGGFAIALLGIAIHHSVASKSRTNNFPVWYCYLFVIGFSLLVGVVWEFHEYIFDQTINVWYNLSRAQPTVADTMEDFLMDWLGASLAFFWFRKQLC